MVDELRALDRQFRVFGSKRANGWGHGYRFNDLLRQSHIDAFERDHRIRLPSDYQEFIVEIGDGGAGPHYGVQTLAEASKYSSPSAIFPWTAEITLSTDDEFDLWETLPGVLVIAERGCGYTDVLVVNGDAHGEIWSDFSVVDCPLSPSHVTFLEWYVDWATRCIATIKREPLIKLIRVGMAIDDVREVLGTDMRRWSGTANLPDSPAYYIGFANTNASFSMDEHDRVKRVNKTEQV